MTFPSPTANGTIPSWSETPLSFTSYAAPASAKVAVTVVSATAYPTDAEYAVVPDANTGDSVTSLSDSALRPASAEPALVTVTVYVVVTSPSCAVTTTAMTFPSPTAKGTMPS